MSKPAAGKGPAPKQPSWWLMAAWLVLLYVTFQNCQHMKDQKQVKPVVDNLAQLRALSNQGVHEGTSTTILADIQSNLAEDARKRTDLVKVKKLSQADADAQTKADDATVVEATMLTADADRRAAEMMQAEQKSQALDKFQAGYQMLYALQQKYEDSPLWQTKYKLGNQADGKPLLLTPAELYDKTLAELSAESARSPVYGFIPGYRLIDLLVKLTGSVPGFSYWFAALLLAAIIRGAIWPLTQKQLMFGRQMSQLAPMLREIKSKFPDQATQQKKTMELYSEYGINPLAGCWPAFLQMPLFLGVYQCMIRYRFEFQKGTFLWMNNAVSHSTHGFTAPNLGQKDTPLIIIYAITLLISTLLTPVSDPTQVRQQRIIGVSVALIFPFFMLVGTYPVSAAFVLYWTFTNIFATVQSLRAYYLLPTPPLVKVNTTTGGVVPVKRKQGFMDRMQEQMRLQFEEKQRQMEQQATELRDKGSKLESASAADPMSDSKPSDPPKGGKQKPKKRDE